MHAGKLVFAQLMDHLPPMVFERCVARYGGNHKVKSFTCMDQYLCMAFAQLTFLESLRDIEACLRSRAEQLYHKGIRGRISRNTLANANATRNWRIYADFARRLTSVACKLYAEEPFGVDLANTAYALDSTTIDLSLSLFPWAPFRSTKAAVKMHTLLDLRGNIPSFIHISDGKLHDVNILDQLIPEAGAFYVMDRGYIDFARLRRLHQAGSFFVTRAKKNMDAQLRYSHARGSIHGRALRSDTRAAGLPIGQGLPGAAARYPLQGPRDRQKTAVHHQQHCSAGAEHLCSVQSQVAGGALLSLDKAAFTRQGLFRYYRERREVPNLDRCIGLCSGGHRAKAAQPLPQPLRNPTDFEPQPVRENPAGHAAFSKPRDAGRPSTAQPADFVQITLGQA